MISSEKLIVEKSLRLGFSATNNEAKYEALLEGMSMVQRMRGKVGYNDLRSKAGRRLSERQIRGKG